MPSIVVGTQRCVFHTKTEHTTGMQQYGVYNIQLGVHCIPQF